MGKAIGKEVRLSGRHQILGPGVNIIRSPLCGRNFEYLSEDPILSSDIATEIVKGIQSENVASCIKHYITNNSETERMKISTEVSERAFQEIYVKNYKRIIEKADPWGLMVCYNKISGTYGAENKYILTDVLVNQLGFTGHVVTDWGAAQRTSGPSACIKAGLNLEMPGNFLLSRVYTRRKIKKALDKGEINIEDINRILKPLLRTFFRVGLFEQTNVSSQKIIDIPQHQEIAQKIAEESMVLLKNDKKFLPINLDKIRKIAIIGPNASKKFGKPFYGGSSAVVPPFEITPYEGIKNYISDKVELMSKTEDADVVFLVLGLGHGASFLLNFFLKREGDTEGSDRTRYKLPEKQQELIAETLQKNPNTVVILVSGSPIDVSGWYNDVPAILNAWYPGMMGGNALARILFGDVNPSGKLPVTYPKRLEDHPAHKSTDRFPGDLKEMKIFYDEGICVGYRYFDEKQIDPFFSFGFGLSYTNFNLSNLRLDKDIIKGSGEFTISIDIENIGEMAGAEVIQVYIEDNKCSVDRPPKELQGFEKVYLEPGEKKTVDITLDETALEFYSISKGEFIIEEGTFSIYAGSSSRDLPLSTKLDFVK
jgi:beta-glucosidase